MDPSSVGNLRRRVAAGLSRARRGRVLIACSGGADSMALLDAACAVAGELALGLEVASVDHGLRPEAAGEAESVRRAAAARGLPAAVLRVQLERPSMAAARAARYAALTTHAEARGCGWLAVAHTATDQAETLLDRLSRGAGLRGLSAMARERPCGPGLRLVRPLLDVTAEETRAYAAALGLAIVRDPTNQDPRYKRSRLRHEVLPLLRRERPGLDRALVALCDRLRADADALDAEAARLAAALTRPDGLDVRALAALPAALAARVLARSAPAPLESVHLDALARLCASLDGTRALDLPGVRAERRYDRLRFGPATPDPGDVELPVTGPGEYALLGRTVAIAESAWAALGPAPLVLRNLRRGDLVGGHKRLKDLLIDRKIPRPERRRLLLLVRPPSEVLWADGVHGTNLHMSTLTRESPVQ